MHCNVDMHVRPTSTCMPKQIPKKGILLRRANSIAFTCSPGIKSNNCIYHLTSWFVSHRKTTPCQWSHGCRTRPGPECHPPTPTPAGSGHTHTHTHTHRGRSVIAVLTSTHAHTHTHTHTHTPWTFSHRCTHVHARTHTRFVVEVKQQTRTGSLP